MVYDYPADPQVSPTHTTSHFGLSGLPRTAVGPWPAPRIQGFATQASYALGEEVIFKVKTSSSASGDG